MKKILLTILLLVVVAILGVLALAAARPDTYVIDRSVTIAAPPDHVYAFVNDFHRWPEWSPWEKLDPAMKRTYEGAESGVGSSYHWVGNDDVGEGRMTIEESEPGAKIGIRLDFITPWRVTNQTTFAFAPAADGTRLTWTMNGRNDFMSKVFTVFMSMDQMIGKDFESGLASLKTLAEGSAPAASAPPDSAATP